MGFIDKLKSVFVVEDDPSSPSPAIEKNDEDKIENVVESENTDQSVKAEAGKFVNVLFSSLEKSNLEGFDYLEFMQSISNLKNQNITNEEEKLFQTAFAMATTLGVEKNKLIETAQHYLSVLESEKTHFNNSLNNTAKNKIDEKNKELKSVKNKIIEIQQQITALNTELEKNKESLNSISQELNQAESKVALVKNGFETAYQSLVNKIQSDISKITKYL
ncbi:MAG: hypothetical protein R2771_13780 [Saprospiraceae bacterium]